MVVMPVPFRDDLVSAEVSGSSRKAYTRLSPTWARWVSLLAGALKAVSVQMGSATLTAVGAATVATAVPTPTLSSGGYLVRYYVRVTRAATTSSSLTVTVSWTDGGVVCSASGAALIGNLTTTCESGVRMVRVDVGTTITYAVAYASVGATSMQYALMVGVDAVPV